MELIDSPLINDTQLKGYWRLNGSSVHTFVGPDGSDSNMSYTTGLFNQAGSFNGSSSSVSLGTTIDLSSTSFTLIGWLKSASNTNDRAMIAQGDVNSTRQEMQFFLNNSTGEIKCAFFSDDLNSGATITDTSWHHVAFTFNSSTNLQAIYLDGALASSRTGGGSLSVGGKALLLGNFKSSNWFNGLLDDWAVFFRDLTAAEVLSLYRGGNKNTLFGTL